MTYSSPQKTFLIGKESAWGTAVTADKDVGLVQEVSDNLSREVIETMALGAIDTQKITSGMVDVGCSVTVEFQHGRLLEYVFGTVAHQLTSSDTKHTFTVNANPPSASIESSENSASDTVLTHEGMLVENAELSIALNETLKLKVDFKGQSTTSTTSAAAALIDNLAIFPHALVTITIDGTPATEVQNFSIKFVKKVERSGGLSSNLYQQGHGTELRFEYSGQLGFASEVYDKLFLGGSGGATTPSATADPAGFPLIFDADNGVTLGQGQRQVKVTLGNCINRSHDKVASIGNLIFVDIAGHGTLTEAFSVDDIVEASW